MILQKVTGIGNLDTTLWTSDNTQFLPHVAPGTQQTPVTITLCFFVRGDTGSPLSPIR